MKFNRGFIPTLILFLVFVASISFLVYIEPNHYGLGQVPLFSFLNKEIEDMGAPSGPTGPLPSVDIGPDIHIKYPKTSVFLKGTASADDKGPLSYEWFKLSGGLAKIATPFSETTNITGLKKGKYLFRLIVTDSKGVKSADELYVTMEGGPAPVKVAKKTTTSTKPSPVAVLPNPVQTNPNPTPTPSPTSTTTLNGAPVSNAGPDKEITLPTSSVTLNGSGTDSGATIVSYSWNQSSGAQANIESPSQAVTIISGLSVAGSYVFTLTVTDDQGFSDTDTVVVTVNDEIMTENNPPEANAGPNQSITLPEDSVTLSGSGTDSDGYIVSYAWTQISGSQASITSPADATTTVTGLGAGTYIFRLIVTDDKDDSDSSTVTITVNPPSQP